MNLTYETPAFREEIENQGERVQWGIDTLLRRIEHNSSFQFQRAGKHGVSAINVPGRPFQVLGFKFDSKRHKGVSLFCLFEYVPEGTVHGRFGTWLDGRTRPLNLTDETLEEEIEKRLPKNQPALIQKQLLPEEFQSWLKVSSFRLPKDKDPFGFVVKETKKWREDIREPFDKSMGSSIHELIGQFYFGAHEGRDDIKEVQEICPALKVPEGRKVFLLETQHNGIILCEYKACDSSNDETVLILIDVALTPDDPSAWLHSKLTEYFAKSDQFFPLRRAYPGRFFDLTGQDRLELFERWRDIENNDRANIAMSDEERDILKSLTRDSNCMPTFINGPAGSGKSTILQYLFAHYWSQKHSTGLPGFSGSPIFLTLSKTLLEDARRSVASILTLDSENVGKDDETIRKELSSSFISFRDLLAAIIGEAECNRRFPARLEIDFENFRKLLRNETFDDPAWNKASFKSGQLPEFLTPELCWHVIRSYIKGYSPDVFLSAESFRSLRGDVDPFVSDEAFSEVCLRVWPWYKRWTVDSRTSEEALRLWDQQDLARFALRTLTENRESLPPLLKEVTAVFCDEAQDLTGVELQIVQQISCLSQFQLELSGAGLPFAFAADPMQTLNPSGFRWEYLKANIYRNLLKPLGLKTQRGQGGLQSLTFNYRSPKEITLFSNLVQLSRKALFGGPVHAQIPYNTDVGTPIVRTFSLESEDPLTDGDLQELSDSIFVLPCDVEREEIMIQKYKLLQKVQEKNPDQTFLSVMSVKGVDIKKVVVFGFGEELFSKPLPETFDGNSKDIALSYKLNKLYVAVTRSTDQMLILDTAKGKQNLWSVLDDAKYREKCLSSIQEDQERQKWADHLPTAQLDDWDPGRVKFATLDFDSLLKQAEDLFRDALAQQNSRLMVQAKNFYARASKDDEATKCEAYNLWFKGHHSEAAKVFDQIQRERDAVDCLWGGKCWSDLAAHSGLNEDQRRIVNLMVSPMTEKNVFAFFQPSPLSPTLEFSPQFEDVFKQLIGFAKNKLKEATWSPFTQQTLETLVSYLNSNAGWCPEPPHALLFALAVNLAIAADDLPADDVSDRRRTLLWEYADKYQMWDDPSLGQNRLKKQAYHGRGPDFAMACRELSDFSIFHKRWKTESASFVAKDVDAETRNWIFTNLIATKHNAEAIQFALDTGDFEKILNSRQNGLGPLSFDDLFHCFELIARDQALYPEFFEKSLGQALATSSSTNISRIIDVLMTSSRVAGSMGSILSERIANLLKDKLLAVLDEGVWPSGATDVLKAGALFEKLGHYKSMLEFGLGCREKHNPLFENAAIEVWVRGRRLTYDRFRKHGDPAENIFAETQRQVLSWGKNFSELWKKSQTEIYVSSQEKAAPDIEMSLEELRALQANAMQRKDREEYQRLSAIIARRETEAW